jgi:hypothetical protein
MAFAEDLDIFLDLDGFGVPVTAGAVSGVGILDKNAELIINGEIDVVDYLLIVSTALFGNLGYGSTLVVDGQTYKAERVPGEFDDGVFCRIPLIKVPAAVAPRLSRLLRTGSGLTLRTGGGRALQTQPY